MKQTRPQFCGGCGKQLQTMLQVRGGAPSGSQRLLFTGNKKMCECGHVNDYPDVEVRDGMIHELVRIVADAPPHERVARLNALKEELSAVQAAADPAAAVSELKPDSLLRQIWGTEPKDRRDSAWKTIDLLCKVVAILISAAGLSFMNRKQVEKIVHDAMREQPVPKVEVVTPAPAHRSDKRWYVVSGTDRATGQAVTKRFKAVDELRAKKRANENGISVVEVSPD